MHQSPELRLYAFCMPLHVHKTSSYIKWMLRVLYFNEEVYVSQPPRFENFEYPNHVYKLKRALYGLKKAPRAWYERLSKFLLEQGFSRGKVDTTLFIKRQVKNSILV